MKKFLLAAIACAIFISPAAGQNLRLVKQGWYWEAGVGANVIGDSNWYYPPPVNFPETNYYDVGFRGYIALGWVLSSRLRTEIEASYRSNSPSFTFGNATLFTTSGRISAATLMANAYYDLASVGRLTPFIGAGLGYALLDINTNFPGYNFTHADGSDHRFAWQVMLGGSYAIDQRYNLVFKYTFLDTAGDLMRPFNTNVGNAAVLVPYHVQSGTIGLRVSY